jgi:hypothetical protein
VAELEQLGPLVHDLLTGAYLPAAPADNPALRALLDELEQVRGIRFSQYKMPTIQRRLACSRHRARHDRHAGRPMARLGRVARARAGMAIAEEGVVNFETKVALLVRDDLLTWQGLNVAAFLATGIAGAARDAMGEPYEDAAGRRYVPLLGQPIMIYTASGADLLKARRIALERGLTTAAYVAAMFATGHDKANREAFRAEPADAPDLVGLAVRGPRKDVDKATKGLRLHP